MDDDLKHFEEEYGNDIIDFPDLIDRGIDLEFLCAIFEMFVDEVTYQLTALEAAVKDDNDTVVEICGHTIKGAASNISAFKLQYLAAIIEHAGKERRVIEAQNKMTELKNEFKKVVSFLNILMMKRS